MGEKEIETERERKSIEKKGLRCGSGEGLERGEVHNLRVTWGWIIQVWCGFLLVSPLISSKI